MWAWAERMTFAKASSSCVVAGSGSHVTGSLARHSGGTHYATSRAAPSRNKAPVGLARCSLKQSAWSPKFEARNRISSVTGLGRASTREPRRSSTVVKVSAKEAEASEYWALRDVGEGDTKALGVEIRTNSVKAALIETSTGSFVAAGAATRLTSVDEENLKIALTRMVEKFEWEGVVGCSITKAVARSLGVDTASFSKMDRDVGILLKGMLPNNTVITMIHTEAGGYNELAYGNQLSGKGLELMITIGRAMGAVLYKDGYRVRNTGMNTKIICGWEGDLEELEKKYPSSFPKTQSGSWGGLPAPAAEGEEGHEAWRALNDLVTKYMRELSEYLKPDALLLMPTGTAAGQAEVLDALITNVRAASSAFEHRPLLELCGSSGGAMVKGAAVGAVVERRVDEGINEFRKAVDANVVMLQRLTPTQLRAVFEVFDKDADGEVTPEDMKVGLRMIGVETTEEKLAELLCEGENFDNNCQTVIDFAHFNRWWQSRVKEGPVTKITSTEEWGDILARDGDSRLIVLQVGFTFCRPCLAFGPKYEKLAQEYSESRFVKVNGNENRSTIELCRDQLAIERTPTFVFYKNKEEVHRHTGTDLDVFHEAMAKHLVPASASVDAA